MMSVSHHCARKLLCLEDFLFLFPLVIAILNLPVSLKKLTLDKEFNSKYAHHHPTIHPRRVRVVIQEKTLTQCSLFYVISLIFIRLH